MRRRCSRWTVCGFVLLVLVLLAAGARYWYASTMVPALPLRHLGKGVYFSPRDDAQLEAVVYGAIGFAFASLISLVGLLRGPRNRDCVLLSLTGPILVMTLLVALQLAAAIRRL